MYQFNIYQNTAIVNSYQTSDFAEARKFYYKMTASPYQYTELVYCGYPKTTAQAERIFGAKDYTMRRFKLEGSN